MAPRKKADQTKTKKRADIPDEVSRVFSLIDVNNTGYITYDCLKELNSQLNEGIEHEDLLEMIQEADTDGDGKINIEDFHEIMKRTGLI